MTKLYTVSTSEKGERLFLPCPDRPVPQGGLLALGCFDGVHPGHRALLKKARAEADRLGIPLGVWSPAGAKTTGRLLTLEEKLSVFASLGVDFYIEVPFEEIRDLSPMEFVEGYLMDRYAVRALACGENFTFGKDGQGDAETLQMMAAFFTRITYIVPLESEGGAPISSNRVRTCLAEGDLEGAKRLLGENYGFHATVEAGRRVGRALGFPTANLPLPKGSPLKRGVYALWVWVDGKRLPALANVGVHPTFQQAEEPLLEAYLLKDPECPLYGKELRVEFLRFLRPERAFSSPEELKAQISRDVALALSEVFCSDGKG